MSPVTPYFLILIGPPGVGKGTQSLLLESRLGLEPLSSGVVFRSEIEAQTDLGRLAQRYIEHGELVPNGVTIEMMSKRIHSEKVRKSGCILDGFPRTLRQAEALAEILLEMDVQLNRVISLELPDEVIMGRLAGRLGCTKCGEIYHSQNKPPKRPGLCDKCNSPLFVRTDDREEAILERLKTFHQTIEPLEAFYEEHHLLTRIAAGDDPEDVYSRICKSAGIPLKSG